MASARATGRDEVLERYLEAARQLVASGMADLPPSARETVREAAEGGTARLRLVLDFPRAESDSTSARCVLVAADGTEVDVFAAVLPPG